MNVGHRTDINCSITTKYVSSHNISLCYFRSDYTSQAETCEIPHEPITQVSQFGLVALQNSHIHL